MGGIDIHHGPQRDHRVVVQEALVDDTASSGIGLLNGLHPDIKQAGVRARREGDFGLQMPARSHNRLNIGPTSDKPTPCEAPGDDHRVDRKIHSCGSVGHTDLEPIKPESDRRVLHPSLEVFLKPDGSIHHGYSAGSTLRIGRVHRTDCIGGSGTGWHPQIIRKGRGGQRSGILFDSVAIKVESNHRVIRGEPAK